MYKADFFRSDRHRSQQSATFHVDRVAIFFLLVMATKKVKAWIKPLLNDNFYNLQY